MSRGVFLSFEGLDGSGKTTQMGRLGDALERSGRRVVRVRQPGGTVLGDQIRQMVLDSRGEANLGPIAPGAELALMFADRAQAILEIIAPALESGAIVLCDRYTDSTEAYQGGGRELGSEAVLALDRAVCGGLKPDLTILLLPPLEVSLRRARRRNGRVVAETGVDENRFEREGLAFYGRVQAAYERIAEREPGRVVTVRSVGGLGSLGSVDGINKEIERIVAERLLPGVEWV